MRFEPGSKRNVPGGKKIAWKARNAGSKATAKVSARASAAATDHAGGPQHDRADRRGSPRIRLALKTATIAATTTEIARIRRGGRRRACATVALIQQRRLAGERGIEVAIGEEVDEDLAGHPADFLPAPERLGHAVDAPGAAT